MNSKIAGYLKSRASSPCFDVELNVLWRLLG
jgi:hypothetical protein